MKNAIRLILIMFFVMLISSCMPDRIKEEANKEFGDQNFKAAIALIELHKTREGEYPETLDSLKYIGGFDKTILSSVKYRKLDTGYNLDLMRGWMGKPKDLKYPDDFWEGLRLVESNLKK